MKFTTSFLTGALASFAASAAFVNAASHAARSAGIVWDPTITSPNADTVWVVGTVVNVTWSTANQPPGVMGGEITFRNADLSIGFSLASFDLGTAGGFFPVTVPDVPTGQYEIVLFGDSGNSSPFFEVVNNSD